MLLVLGALSVSAEVYSQNGLVSLKMKDVSLVKVFNEITKQTGYDFLYNYDLVQNKGTVDVNAKMVDLKDFLHDLLKGKNLGFEFRDGAIIVRGESVRLDDQKIKSRTIKGIVRDKTQEIHCLERPLRLKELRWEQPLIWKVNLS